ncbi:MAG: protein translocase subunit SecD [Rhodospirillaceae bacterium]|nr:protein translocase subunit SecD [Rhodospirillaceae bacterium]
MVRFERWKIALVVGILVLGVLFSLPNFFSRDAVESWPDWIPNKQISLGLDLQGGSHLLMEVEVGAVVRERLESLVDEARVRLRGDRIGYTGLGVSGNAVHLTIRDTGQIDAAVEILRDIDRSVIVSSDPDGTVTLTLTEQAMTERQRSAVDQSIEIIRRRIDETGTREPTIQRQGEQRILVQLPGVDDPERIKSLLGTTAKMNFRLVDDSVPVGEAVRGRVPPGSELLYGEDDRIANGQPVPYVVRKRVGVSGENLTDAQATFQQGQPVVSLRFDAVGARRFADLTKENVGRRFAIVLDNKVISAPVIREPIPGGSGVISGSFTVQSAQDLALLLRAGALPAPLIILEERTVGPSLGADSIRAGEFASLVGLVLVVIYIIAAYGLFGLMATVALFGNMVMIFALLTALQATLTLPGIAGIVLTIGMAVDANVLIFERIREEVKDGRSPISAVDIGFRQALRAIVDSNLTTLIAAVILYQFGSGPVRGFAVTLAIGIATSMFTAIMVTRMFVVLWLQRRRPQQLPV